MAHTSPYLFFLLSNCTYNSHILKNENYLAYFMRILNYCVVTHVSDCQPWLSVVRHTSLIDSYATRQSRSHVFLQL